MMTAASEELPTREFADSLYREAEQFLFREAFLMDEHHYSEWEALWTDDVTYWVPINGADYDPDWNVSLIYDNRELLDARITRLEGDRAYAQRPKSQLRRVVSNIEVGAASERTLEVYSNFFLTEYRRDEMQLWSGRNIHRLVRSEEGRLKMRYKKVILTNNSAPLPNCSFLI